MPATGIRRKVDDLGRVVIPAGIRRVLGIREGDVLEVALEGDRVVFAKPVDRCALCQAEDAPMRPVRGRLICEGCIAAVTDLALAPPDALSGPLAAAPPTPTVVTHLPETAPAAGGSRRAATPAYRFEERYLP